MDWHLVSVKWPLSEGLLSREMLAIVLILWRCSLFLEEFFSIREKLWTRWASFADANSFLSFDSDLWDWNKSNELFTCCIGIAPLFSPKLVRLDKIRFWKEFAPSPTCDFNGNVESSG